VAESPSAVFGVIKAAEEGVAALLSLLT